MIMISTINNRKPWMDTCIALLLVKSFIIYSTSSTINDVVLYSEPNHEFLSTLWTLSLSFWWNNATCGFNQQKMSLK